MSKAPRQPGPLWGGPNPRAGGQRPAPTRRRQLLVALTARTGLLLARLCWLTYRVRLDIDPNSSAALEAGGPFVYVCWHRWGTLGCYYIQRCWGAHTRPAFLVSPSRDGDFAAAALNRLGGRVVRGSATRTSIRSLRELYRVMTRETASPVLLPDGPTGPAQSFKPGAAILAQMASRPLLLVGFHASRTWQLPTWDGHAIPCPFARLRIRVATAPAPSRSLDSAGLEQESTRLGHCLDRLCQP